jgi:ubiquinone/menaquinone biosynthesis C-methylase UbiE
MTESGNDLNSSRTKREKDFHDQRFSDDHERRSKVHRFYKITHSIHDEYRRYLLEHCKELRIIEYGCGPGSYAFDLAGNGAKSVIGIDISSVAIEMAKSNPNYQKLYNLDFVEMDAEHLEFGESSVDLIAGSGILHHLNLNRAMHSITKVLQTEGSAVFIEPLGHNLFINLFRRLTPQIRSTDEHPLLINDLSLLNKYFKKVEIKYFYLTSIVASTFIGFPGFEILLSFLEAIDQLLFKLPIFQKQAWQVLLKLSYPTEITSVKSGN